ncbi:MAG: OsmC family protein [Phycisphaeraceae bacterium]|nr:OsmC family protein [Phycisphaeraceae bacterium]
MASRSAAGGSLHDSTKGTLMAKQWTVSATNDGAQYQTPVVVRTWDLLADEPADLGGTDLGPTPAELLLAALASCKVITLRMYAARKGLPLRTVTCTVEGGIDTPEAPLRVTLDLTGDLDDAQRDRLREIASRCPVERLLQRSTEVVTALAPSPTAAPPRA